jgi:hypothetical protein
MNPWDGEGWVETQDNPGNMELLLLFHYIPITVIVWLLFYYNKVP